MPEAENPMLLPLLCTCAGLLVVALILIFRISGRLTRIEMALKRPEASRERPEEAPLVAETSPGGAFEVFLNEDPARRELTKPEQFAAYRQWRHEKGMNWSNSGASQANGEA